MSNKLRSMCDKIQSGYVSKFPYSSPHTKLWCLPMSFNLISIEDYRHELHWIPGCIFLFIFCINNLTRNHWRFLHLFPREIKELNYECTEIYVWNMKILESKHKRLTYFDQNNLSLTYIYVTLRKTV